MRGDAEMEVAIIGAGPAGCSAAIVLAEAGWRVVVYGRPPAAGDRIGESLSPGAPTLLERLDLRTRFLDDGHLLCHANASAWGSSELAWHDFIADPRGGGFHIDRPRFEALLRARACEAGARLILSDGTLPSITARYRVDASGRAACLARAFGARRELAWSQVALVTFARTGRPCDETFTLVEAVPEGFWYSAPIPGGRFAVALFTDAGLHDARRARTIEGMHTLLANAPRTRDRLDKHAAVLDVDPRFVGADSGRTDPVQGPGWIAVGDAALTYDPVSAHGLTLALRTGVDAADTLLADAAGDTDALARYGARLARAFHDYRREALRIYASEQRWPQAPYWHKRHELARAQWVTP
jgi:flavin-dependent dehydrogenase